MDIFLGICGFVGILLAMVVVMARGSGKSEVEQKQSDTIIEDLKTDAKIDSEYGSIDVIAARQRMRDKVKQRMP